MTLSFPPWCISFDLWHVSLAFSASHKAILTLSFHPQPMYMYTARWRTRWGNPDDDDEFFAIFGSLSNRLAQHQALVPQLKHSVYCEDLGNCLWTKKATDLWVEHTHYYTVGKLESSYKTPQHYKFSPSTRNSPGMCLLTAARPLPGRSV
ncbi:hypothetical protein B0H14DRAFT_2609125 [Mycena olivaceomarginata]|nr:hypothetical protein B0H14DRAFT_2609125 [Mycena olivaceomarginata]